MPTGFGFARNLAKSTDLKAAANKNASFININIKSRQVQIVRCNARYSDI